MRFAAAPEYQVFPTRERPLKPYEAVRSARRARRAALVALGRARRRSSPTSSRSRRRWPASSRACRRRRSSPTSTRARAPGFPPYSLGARLPRTARRARRCGGALDPLDRARAGARARSELNETRAAPGAARRWTTCTAASRARLALVATFPQLEYPRAVAEPDDARRRAAAVGAAVRRRRAARRATRRSCWSRRRRRRTPSTGCCARRWPGSPTLPVRVLAHLEPPRRRPAARRCPANARLVEWVSYARTMPRCDLVVCHGGHGTLARALACGCAVVAVPAGGRHERERRARRLGRRRRAPAAALRDAARRAAWRWSARWPTTAMRRARARAGRLGRGARPGRAGGGARRGVRPRSVRYELVFASWKGSGSHRSWTRAGRSSRSGARSASIRRRSPTGRTSTA